MILLITVGLPSQVFAASSPSGATISSDLADYPPGATVTLTGSGWAAGEAVHIFVNDDAGQTWSLESNPDPVADVAGEFVYQFQLPAWFVATYSVTATGAHSGTATTTFTDSAGSYTIKWYAADPALNRGPYLPTYTKYTPAFLACPAAGLSGGAGRAADPLANAVAYASPPTSGNLDAVTSLAPRNTALGQIVPYELEVVVSGSTTPENGIISVTPYWLTKTTSGDNYGFDPTYMVYCAFVDTADPGTVDPGANAKVSSYTSSLVNPGTSNEQIQGTFTLSGLNNGDRVIVEIWTVLKNTIPAGASGNVQTGMVSAQTGTGAAISTGNQTVPLLKVQEFFSASADVAITKSDNPDPVVQGQQLTYTLTVTNQSTDTVANGIVVTDTLDANTTFVSGTWAGGTCTAASGVVTCNVGALSPGQSIPVTLVVTVSATAPISNDPSTNPEIGACTAAGPGIDLCNKVSISAITSDPTSSNNSASAPTNVVAAPAPSLSLTKQISTSASGPWSSSITVAGGSPVYYKFSVTNTGNVALSPVSVSDPNVSTASCAFTDPLPTSNTTTCVVGPVTAATLAGTYPNTATAHGGYGSATYNSSPSTAEYIVAAAPALSLVKTATPGTYDAVGDVISYSYLVKNTGNVTLAGPVTVTDDKATVTCPAGGLAPGASLTCTASYTITQADLDGGSVKNTAVASANGTDSNKDDETVTADQKPALSLVKTATPTTYDAVGDVISYSYLVKNTGNVTLAGPVTVTDDKATVTCPAGGLAPGVTMTCTASYTITQADLDGGSVKNIALASANGTDSNKDDETVTADKKPALSLVKTATPATYDAVGDVISYSYLVKNTGNVTLAGPVTVTDDKATVTCPAGGLAPGASLTCTASYTITQADLDGGSVKNIALASANGTDSNKDDETVTADKKPALSLVKTATPATYDAVGDVISYSYLVKNTGNVTLAGPVTVTDDKATVTCPAGGLAPSATMTCTASYTITQADLDGGSVKNTAQAHANQTDSNTDDETVTADKKPALSLVKTATPATYDAVGDVISYSYLVKNTGNVTLAGPVTVTDDKATVTCPAGGLAPGATMTCTASYTITQADLDGGSVKNIALASANGTDSNKDDETVTADQKPALSLVKTATPTTYDAVGDVISYSYLVKNTGNVTLAGPVTVTDDKATVTCPAGGLAPGASLTCTASYTITQADLDGGSVKNTAQAHANKTDSNTDDETVTAVQNPKMSLTKTDDLNPAKYDTVGQVVTYTLTATNTGNITLHAVTVSDNPALSGFVCTPAIPVASLAPGASVVCTGSHSITQDNLNAGSFKDTASASSTETRAPDASDIVYASQGPALSLVKTATPATYDAAGDVISYSYLVKNVGNVTLAGPVTVTDDKATATCPVGGLAPEETMTCTASYTITQADLDGGSVTNAAFATANGTESNTDYETVTAEQKPALSLVKTATPASYDAVGNVISYSYLVKNTGNVTLAGPVTVTDDKATVTCPAVPVGGFKPGDNLTCTASYTITQADLDAGSVTNTAQAHANQVNSNTDDETVTAVQRPALSLVKTATPITYDAVGDVISYSYLVKNTGNVTLAGPVTVTDDKATVTCPAGGLAPGASLTCTASYTITQADLDAGSVTNTAQAHANQVNSNTDDETVTADQKPALSLVKTATPTTYDAVGDVISYSYQVKNTGNVTLAGPVTVSDDKATVTCPAGGLAPEETMTCTATYTITQADLDGGSVTNTAQAHANEVDSNTDDETVTAEQKPALSLVKTATPAIYSAVGDVISYSYLVQNTGNVTLAGPVTVTDDKTTVTCPAGGLVPLQSMTCTATYTITQADLDTGSVTNTAQAHANEVNSNTDAETVSADQNPALLLIKSATPGTYTRTGDVISYSYLVKNTGNVTLPGPVTVTDDKATVTCPAGGLAPGETMTCTATHSITQADLDAGSLTNVAQAHANEVDSNTDDETVIRVQGPTLIVNKIVAWNGITPPESGQSFILCIQGPSYPLGSESGACKTTKSFLGNGADSLTWTGLLPGAYTVTEPGTGAEWAQVISGSPAAVAEQGEPSVVNVSNTRKLGSLAVTKVVDWNALDPDLTRTFEICISGPSYPVKNCQTAGYNGGLLEWANLLPGTYLITETDPGGDWIVTITSSPVSVPTDGGQATATVTNNNVVIPPTAITLEYFKLVDIQGYEVSLAWKTSAEINNVGYQIYRWSSQDLSSAQAAGPVASVAAQQNGSMGAEYSLTDVVPSAGTWYYWLADVDSSGVITPHAGSIFVVRANVLVQPGGNGLSIYLPMISGGR